MITNYPVNKSTRAILEGVNILLKYEPDAEFGYISNTDVIAFGDSALVVSQEDEAKLEKLGWFVEDFYSFRWAYWI